MDTGKLISSLKITLFSILLFISGQTPADYMVDYGPGPAGCYSCAQPCNRCHREYYHRAHHHRVQHNYHRHWRRPGTYRLEVIYTTTPYPDFYYDTNGCGGFSCQAMMPPPCAAVSHVRYRGYANYPVRVVNTCQGCQSCGQGMSYDTSTSDDTNDYYQGGNAF
jgi:hypothetical protein